MVPVLRNAVLLSKAPVSVEDVIEIARAACAHEGWHVDPIASDVRVRLGAYRVDTPLKTCVWVPDDGGRGKGYPGHVSLVIDARTGAMRRKRLTLRRKKAGAGPGEADGGASAGRPVLPVGPTPVLAAADAKPIPGRSDAA